MRNTYVDLLDDWKVELIRQRAKRFRVPSNDLEQELALALLATGFNPARGASERTFLTTIIDRRLIKWLRKRREQEELVEHSELDIAQRACDLRADVCDILAARGEREQAVAQLLAEGQSVAAISRALQADWHTIRHCVGRLRRRFEMSGLRYWLEG